MEDKDINEIRALLIQMRKYFIQHGLSTGECVAWNKLKSMFGVANSESEWRDNLKWVEEYERKANEGRTESGGIRHKYPLHVKHSCYAPNCRAPVANYDFMCRYHFGVLPKEIREKLSGTYPLPPYGEAAEQAINYFLPAAPGSAANSE